MSRRIDAQWIRTTKVVLEPRSRFFPTICRIADKRNASLFRGNFRESGRDVGENLIVETLSLSLDYKNTMSIARTTLWLGKLPLPTITLAHPLDKIFGDIPARLQSFTHASVMHYGVLNIEGWKFSYRKTAFWKSNGRTVSPHKPDQNPSVLSQKRLYTERHSGLDPESSLFSWIPVFTGMTTLLIIVKKF